MNITTIIKLIFLLSLNCQKLNTCLTLATGCRPPPFKTKSTQSSFPLFSRKEKRKQTNDAPHCSDADWLLRVSMLHLGVTRSNQ